MFNFESSNYFSYMSSRYKVYDDQLPHFYHPIALDNEIKIRQGLHYLHENPVRAGIVWEAKDYKYSSATDYYTNKPGPLPIVKLNI